MKRVEEKVIRCVRVKKACVEAFFISAIRFNIFPPITYLCIKKEVNGANLNEAKLNSMKTLQL